MKRTESLERRPRAFERDVVLHDLNDVRRQAEVIENAAVVQAALVLGKAPPAKALKGELRGENFVVPLTQ